MAINRQYQKPREYQYQRTPIAPVQHPNMSSMARGLESQEEIQRQQNRGQLQTEKQRGRTALAQTREQGKEQRKTATHEQEMQKKLMDDLGLVPSGYKKSGSKSGSSQTEVGLKPNQLWDAWQDFGEPYDMENKPPEGFDSAKDEEIYELNKLIAFKEQLEGLRLLKKAPKDKGGEGGDDQENPKKGLPDTDQGKGGAGGQEKVSTKGEKPTDQRQGTERPRNTPPTPQGAGRTERPTHPAQQGGNVPVRSDAASILGGLGPNTKEPSKPKDAQARREVGFFSDLGGGYGSEGQQYRQKVMQGMADKTVGAIQRAPGRMGQAMEHFAGAPQRASESSGNESARQFLDQAGGAMQELGQAIANSYMNSVESQGQRPQIDPDQVPNLTAEMVKGVFNGDEQAYRTLLDAMDDMVGDMAEAPEAVQGMLRELAGMADEANVDLSSANPDQILGMMQQLFGGQGEQAPEMFQRQQNMRGPVTRGQNRMPTPTSGPRSNVGVPSLKEFDAN